jgi:hypothetical protein
VPSLDEKLDARFAELLVRPEYRTSDYGYIVGESLPNVMEWFLAAANLIGIATSRSGVHWEHAQTVLEDLGKNVTPKPVSLMLGTLSATNEDRKRGLLGDIQYAIYAETFDDFLDVASSFHKSGKLVESAVLASAVLEDTFKKIAERNGVEPDQSLEPIINALVKQGALNPIQAKRAKAYAGVRSSAFSRSVG